MADEHPPARRGDYRAARIASALTLIVVVGMILIWDAISPAYEANPLLVTSVLGAAAALMGVEIIDIGRGNGKP